MTKYNCKFTNFLNQHYEGIREKNQSYSIRAFARRLNIPSSYLLRVMKGKIPATENLVLRLSSVLMLSDIQIEEFAEDIKTSRKSQEESWFLNYPIFEIDINTIKEQSLIDDFFFPIIFEITTLSEFDGTVEYVWRKLSCNLDIGLVQSQLDLMAKLGILIKENIYYTSKVRYLKILNSKRLELIKLKRMEKLIELYSNTSEAEESSFLSMLCISVDEDIITEVNNKVSKFRKELAEFVEENSQKKDRVLEIFIGGVGLG